MPLVPVNTAPSDVKDSQEGLTNELDGAGEDGADEQEEAEKEEAGKPEESDEADVEREEDADKADDVETLRKQLEAETKRRKDAQAALTKARQESKRKPEQEQSSAGSLTEDQALKLYERARSDEKFLDLNPDLQRQAEALRTLRATAAPTSTLEEVALRYGFVEKAKLEAAKARAVRGSVERRSQDDVPSPLRDKEAYKKWRAKNLNPSRLTSLS